MDVIYGIPVIGLLIQFVVYLVEALPVIAPDDRGRRHADRARLAVRLHERALRRGEHRHRGHDADRAFVAWWSASLAATLVPNG